MDEIASPAEGDPSTAPSGASKGPVRAYHEAVLSQRQPRVTDLLPVRPLWVVVALLLGLTCIATIETIHIHAASLPPFEGSQHLAPLIATTPGSLAAWFASAMLATAAMLAIVVFSIRAHRIDDYRGRYRIWLWTAAALTWLSLDCVTGLHNTLGLSLTLVTGKQVVTSSLDAGYTLTWIAVYGLVFGSLGLRLMFELWSSRLSLTALLVAGFLYFDASLFELEVLQPPIALIDGLIESMLTLLGHFSLLAAVGFYGRHVLLDASGRLKVNLNAERKSKVKRAKLKVVKTEEKPQPVAAPAPSKSNEPVKFGAPAASVTAAKPAASIAKSNLSAPIDDDEDEDDEEDYGDSNLSKSERRRLKKVARREQRRAA